MLSKPEDSTMNHIELSKYFKGKLEDYTKIDSRVIELQKKLKQAKEIEEGSLMQINMGTCVFSVSKETAVSMLTDAILIERNYQKLLSERFQAAVEIIEGKSIS